MNWTRSKKLSPEVSANRIIRYASHELMFWSCNVNENQDLHCICLYAAPHVHVSHTNTQVFHWLAHFNFTSKCDDHGDPINVVHSFPGTTHVGLQEPILLKGAFLSQEDSHPHVLKWC